ncbi:hypothetical protein HMPREF9713_01124 [Myroides odoratimimus CCUG 12700]|uniref:hypothetical protein n=1 Tax=Myroides odoratimimus TaxID=76832 RepID=UPI000353B149|nr:hypothetical protein [Myroides odoratimimus]EPH12283.1 hypothetical protein HMPREF9713_01124 [Myroides odoratimimus CCUG 12700]
MSNKSFQRMFVYAQDVAQITGRSYKTSLSILKEIRNAYNKPKNALVSINEFCAYMNVDEAEVVNSLK